MLRRFFLGLSFFTLLVIITPTNVFAGGQLTSLEADSYGSVNSDGTYGRIIRVVTQVLPCEGTVLTFKFVDPKEGDYVITQSGNATFTFTKDREPYYKNGEQACGTTAKMGSKVLGERDVTVIVTDANGVSIDMPPVIKVDFDGKYHADNSYNGYNYRSSQNDPYYEMTNGQNNTNPTNPPAPTIKTWILRQAILNPNNRNVTIKFGVMDGTPATYTIYGKPANQSNWTALLSNEKGPSTTVTIKTNEDYSIKVYGCTDKWGICADSNILAISKINQNEIQNEKIETSQDTNPSISEVPNEDSKVDELNQKVASLEAKLEESKQKQTALEETVNNLLSWIKSYFPFFK